MGVLYLVSTPIGNLEDITIRALRILKEADLILCEDTRQTKKLLDHYQIKKPLESFFEHNEVLKTHRALQVIENGKTIALVTDAGTPTVSDPGFRLVKSVVEKGGKVIPIPGPSAALAALSASGLPTDRFIFVGFLPQKEGKRSRFLEELKNWRGTIVAYESPERLVYSLEGVLDVFGDVPVCVAREMTKVYEEFFRGRVSQALDHFGSRSVKGEVTLVISNS